MPRLYQALIGTAQTAYYQPIFDRFETLGKTLPTWNWAAALLPVGWAGLRNLWKPAALYALALVFSVGLWWIAGSSLPDAVHWGLLGVIGLLAIAVPGLGGNALYYRHAHTQTMQALTQSRTLGEAMNKLKAMAPNDAKMRSAIAAQAGVLLIVGAAVWSQLPALSIASSSSASRPVHTGPTQEDTARALAALMPTPAATSQVATTSSIAEAKAPEVALNPTHTSAGAATELQSLPQPQAHDIDNAVHSPLPPSVSEAPAPAPEASSETKPVAPVKSAEPAADKTTRRSPPKPESKPSTEKKPAKREVKKRADTTSSMQAGSHYLNVGIYAQPDNASKVVKKLQGAGLPVFTQRLDSAKGPVTRVRSGPYTSRAQAERAARKVQGMQLEAQIFRHAS